MLSSLPLEWPIRGRVNSEYGYRRSPWGGGRERHLGIDIGSAPGTPVKSPGEGTVLTASTRGSFGKQVTLDHGNGIKSRYGHLKAVEVKAGQRVERGQVIGRVGSTGRSTGPHLHYEVSVGGKTVDPRGFLPED
jgi:murein DD-endopeptidase MepM/ murein hydrolase activator NlpD